MTLNEAIYDQVRALALSVLPENSPVIAGRQSRPAPGKHYLVVMPIGGLGVDGMASDVQENEFLDHLNDWTGEIDIREIGGDGDWLRILLEATELDNVKTHLTTVTFLSSTEIQDLSYQEGDKWVLEARLGFRITVRTVRREEVGYFDHIQAIGTLDGHTLVVDTGA